MKDLRYIFAFTLLFALSGCEKYVDMKTQGRLTPGSIENYRYLLNNTAVYEVAPTISDIASDDLEIEDGSVQQMALNSDFNRYYYNSYQWADVIYPIEGLYYKDDNWGQLYTTVTYANTVIGEVLDADDGTEAEKNELIAEAKVHRAAAYLMLVNTYAKPYVQATAATDLGVPLVLEQTTEQSLARASVETVYQQILTDLREALAFLPDQQAFTSLPTKASAYGLLARTFLCMNDYQAADTVADQALALRNEVIDLIALDTITTATYPIRVNNPEILLSKMPVMGIMAYTGTAFRMSRDLLSVLDSTDQRYNLFTVPGSIISPMNDYNGRYFYLDRALGEGRNVGPTVPEMMLIKAEVAVRNGDVNGGMNWLNQLREKRVLPAYYREEIAVTADEALVKVINERRREFMFRMLRWWDMRRLKDDPLFRRTYQRTFGGKTSTLAPNSNRYVFPIAAYEINLNPEIEQNP